MVSKPKNAGVAAARMSRAAWSAFALVGLGTIATLTPASAVDPVETGVGYAFHTAAMGNCHATDWYLYVDADKSVNGYASWDRGAQRATITGQIGADNTIHSQGKMIGSNRTANISGQILNKVFTLTVSGTGTPCDGLTWKVPRMSWGGGAQAGN